MKRRDFITLLGGAVAWPLAARAQQATKVPRIGILSPGRSEFPDPSFNMLNALLQRLHELGYTDGQNLAVERQFADGSSDRNRDNAAQVHSVLPSQRIPIAQSENSHHSHLRSIHCDALGQSFLLAMLGHAGPIQLDLGVTPIV